MNFMFNSSDHWGFLKTPSNLSGMAWKLSPLKWKMLTSAKSASCNWGRISIVMSLIIYIKLTKEQAKIRQALSIDNLKANRPCCLSARSTRSVWEWSRKCDELSDELLCD